MLDFAVAQILRDDTALGALPVVLARMVATFGLRAALAFQPSAVKGPATALIGRGRQPYPDTPGARYSADVTVEINGAGVVVTGAGSGIGRALARGLAAAGARVVVNDLNFEAATAVAAEIGGFPAPGDAATEPGVQALVATARDCLGEIDIYCSNAGIAVGAGPDAPEEAWQQSWEVNVLAHVRASRELLPAWLERGRGCFVVTASAAGLLTMLGTATYSVTKHAAESYAEWLAATYGHRGLVVHCICPQGVRTRMLAESGGAGKVVLQDAAIEPEQVAEALLAGMAAGKFLILPHPEVHEYYQMRAADPDRWLRGMNRMQQRIEEVERGMT